MRAATGRSRAATTTRSGCGSTGSTASGGSECRPVGRGPFEYRRPCRTDRRGPQRGPAGTDAAPRRKASTSAAGRSSGSSTLTTDRARPGRLLDHRASPRRGPGLLAHPARRPRHGLRAISPWRRAPAAAEDDGLPRLVPEPGGVALNRRRSSKKHRSGCDWNRARPPSSRSTVASGRNTEANARTAAVYLEAKRRPNPFSGRPARRTAPRSGRFS